MKPRPKRRSVKKERNKKRTVMIFGIFMIVLMVFSFASVMLYNPTQGNQMEYGDYEFRLEGTADGGSVLVTEMNGQAVEFQNLPLQVAHLEYDLAATQMLRDAQQVALTVRPDIAPQTAGFIDYARLQLGLAIGKTFNAITHADSRYQLPVINCSQASLQMPVILFNYTNETAAVRTSDYCITINGADQDFMRLKDRIIFEYHGILENGQVAE